PTELAGAETVALKIKGDQASGTFQLSGPAGNGRRPVTVQAAYRLKDGKLYFTEPVTHQVDLGGGTLASKSPGTGIDPKGTGKDVGGAAREVGRISVQDLKLNAKDILPCMMWSEDGTRFFVLEKEGYLRRIALEGFKEELVLDVNRRCSWLAMSWEGL